MRRTVMKEIKTDKNKRQHKKEEWKLREQQATISWIASLKLENIC